MYLHELGDGAGSFTKDDMQAGLVFHSSISVILLVKHSRHFYLKVHSLTR